MLISLALSLSPSLFLTLYSLDLSFFPWWNGLFNKKCLTLLVRQYLERERERERAERKDGDRKREGGTIRE